MHQDAVAIFHSSVDSVKPSSLFPQLLRVDNGTLKLWRNAPSRWLLSIGKAGLSSAEALLRQQKVDDYFVVSPKVSIPSSLDPSKIHFGSHPLPDEKSFAAADSMLKWLQNIPDGSPLLVLLSGGASSLLASPAVGISEDSKRKLNDLLIRSGANISEINAVRKHVSRVKGGLTGIAVARLETVVLVISDVPNDDLSTIGSGPFYSDSTTFIAAKKLLESYDIWKLAPPDVRNRIEAGIEGKISETPKPGSLSIPHRILASNAMAREAGKQKALSFGYNVEVLPETLVNSVEDAVAKFAEQSKLMPAGSAFIAGGEITIRVQGNGMGGRNQHFALLMSKALAGTDSVFIAAGTDGVDGNSPAAGAWVDGETIQKAQSHNLNVDEFINNFDSFHFFETLNQTIRTGPTGTNVMDLYLLLRKKIVT